MRFTEFGMLISFSHLHLQNAWSPISIKEFGNTTDSNSFPSLLPVILTTVNSFPLMSTFSGIMSSFEFLLMCLTNSKIFIENMDCSTEMSIWQVLSVSLMILYLLSCVSLAEIKLKVIETMAMNTIVKMNFLSKNRFLSDCVRCLV